MCERRRDARRETGCHERMRQDSTKALGSHRVMNPEVAVRDEILRAKVIIIGTHGELRASCSDSCCVSYRPDEKLCR